MALHPAPILRSGPDLRPARDLRPSSAPSRPLVGPEPALRWTDSANAPRAGAFAHCAVPNDALVATLVPTSRHSWSRLHAFALSYDGYAYWDHLPTLANRARLAWARQDVLPESLDELRGCLFYEQRRWHHFADAPHGHALAYVEALTEAVHTVVDGRCPAGAAP